MGSSLAKWLAGGLVVFTLACGNHNQNKANLKKSVSKVNLDCQSCPSWIGVLVEPSTKKHCLVYRMSSDHVTVADQCFARLEESKEFIFLNENKRLNGLQVQDQDILPRGYRTLRLRGLSWSKGKNSLPSGGSLGSLRVLDSQLHFNTIAVKVVKACEVRDKSLLNPVDTRLFDAEKLIGGCYLNPRRSQMVLNNKNELLGIVTHQLDPDQLTETLFNHENFIRWDFDYERNFYFMTSPYCILGAHRKVKSFDEFCKEDKKTLDSIKNFPDKGVYMDSEAKERAKQAFLNSRMQGYGGLRWSISQKALNQDKNLVVLFPEPTCYLEKAVKDLLPSKRFLGTSWLAGWRRSKTLNLFLTFFVTDIFLNSQYQVSVGQLTEHAENQGFKLQWMTNDTSDDRIQIEYEDFEGKKSKTLQACLEPKSRAWDFTP